MRPIDSPAEFPPDDSKRYFLCPVQRLADLPAALKLQSKHFALLLAIDASRIPSAAITAVARHLILRGLVVICCWGPDCERVHDLFTATELQLQQERKFRHPTMDDEVITTAHPRDSLADATFFFGSAAWPTDSYDKTCRDWIAVPVAHPEWEAILLDVIQAGFPLPD